MRATIWLYRIERFLFIETINLHPYAIWTNLFCFTWNARVLFDKQKCGRAVPFTSSVRLLTRAQNVRLCIVSAYAIKRFIFYFIYEGRARIYASVFYTRRARVHAKRIRRILCRFDVLVFVMHTNRIYDRRAQGTRESQWSTNNHNLSSQSCAKFSLRLTPTFDGFFTSRFRNLLSSFGAF